MTTPNCLITQAAIAALPRLFELPAEPCTGMARLLYPLRDRGTVVDDCVTLVSPNGVECIMTRTVAVEIDHGEKSGHFLVSYVWRGISTGYIGVDPTVAHWRQVGDMEISSVADADAEHLANLSHGWTHGGTQRWLS